MKKTLFIAITCILTLLSCSKDNSLNGLKGIVSFKAYTLPGGLQDVIYANNQIKFKVELQLMGSSQSVNADLAYHLLEGTQKIGQGTVKINQNLDGGMGMFWGADEHAVTIDAAALKGKTITVYLDPENKFTAKDYTTETYINLYKKSSVTIP